MQIYSERLSLFIARLSSHALHILEKEMGMQVGRKRFFYKRYSYPIHIVCFDDSLKLGYFQPDLLEIGIHHTLLFKEDLAIDVLRHELAHYITFIETRETGHGKAFHEICSRYGFSPEVARATLEGEDNRFKEASDIQRKVEKLLKLSESSNPHEAEAALLKAEELIKAHSVIPAHTEDTIFYMARVLETKKFHEKHKTICSLLRHFNVEVILRHGAPSSYIEIIGDKTAVEIAEYIADYLDHNLDALWGNIKTKYRLKGLAAKNSFFRGFSDGYQNKNRPKTKETALMDMRLKQALSLVYPKLSTSYSSFVHDSTSHKLGQKEGDRFSINPGINSSKQSFLPHF